MSSRPHVDPSLATSSLPATEAHSGVSRRPAVRVNGHAPVRGEEPVVAEAPLEIRLNGEPFSVTMRTPGNDEALVRGLLFAEQIIGGNSLGFRYQAEDFDANGIPQVAAVTLPPVFVCEGAIPERRLAATSSCGLCGQQSWQDVLVDAEPLESGPPLPAGDIFLAFSVMRQHQDIFAETGGSHASAVFDRGGRMLAVCEDIGRHNAVDKVVGELLARGQMEEACLLLVSGRISFEITVKAYRAGLPWLVAVSAPSSLAIDTARRLGMTLGGFCRDRRITLYSHAEQVSFDE